jgi:HPt (histidine-containing phosphotransfer) domain-containing protein
MNQPPEPEKGLQELLDTLWKNNYPKLLERLRILREAHRKLSAGTLDPQARHDGEDAAHKLAGILGTFGLPEGSALASKIEVLLAQEAGAEEEHELQSWLDELEAIIASKG